MLPEPKTKVHAVFILPFYFNNGHKGQWAAINLKIEYLAGEGNNKVTIGISIKFYI